MLIAVVTFASCNLIITSWYLIRALWAYVKLGVFGVHVGMLGISISSFLGLGLIIMFLLQRVQMRDEVYRSLRFAYIFGVGSWLTLLFLAKS